MCPNHFENGKTLIPVARFYQMVRELTTELDLRVVLRKALAFSLEITGATGGSAAVLNDHGEVVAAIIMAEGRVHENTTVQLREVLHRGLAGWVVTHKEPALVEDTTEDARWLRGFYDEGRTDGRSAMSVPLLIKNQLVGVFTVVHPQPRTFRPEHLQAFQAFVDVVAPTVMNALLYARSRRQARLMQIWAESALVITETWDVEEIIEGILRQIEHALRTQAVLLVLRGEGSEWWVSTNAAGTLADRLLGLRFAPPEEEDACPSMEVLQPFAVRTTACALLKDKEQPLGALIAVNPLEGRFTPEMRAFLQGMASVATTALRRVRLFEEIQNAHQQYRDLFNDTLDWIFITDPQGYIVEANQHAKESLGYRWEEIRNGTLPITVIHTLPPILSSGSLEDIPDAPPLVYESEARTRDGKTVPVEVYVRRIRLGREPHLQWILRDITERKRLDTMRDDLLAMLYHDLRAPLASLSMSMALLQQSCDSQNEETQSLFTIAERALNRMTRLTANILDLNRLKSGQMPLRREATDAAALVSGALEIVAPQADQKGQTLITEVPLGLPPVDADHEIIRRVLINLMENAVKYTPEGSLIRVGARPEGDFVRFWVQDNGPGIPPEEQEQIFEKYQRGQRQGSKGLGLGLAFARLAIEAHGGQIGVESTPGNGSLFYFTLPLASPET